jgi:cytochrome c oxidase cbb3-type subunit 3
MSWSRRQGHGWPVAPNLADKIWLYSSAEETIIETITKGRANRMPAFGEFLGDAKVHLLTAYIFGLGGGVKDAPPAAVAELRSASGA